MRQLGAEVCIAERELVTLGEGWAKLYTKV